jgi:hypothetical protein
VGFWLKKLSFFKKPLLEILERPKARA